MRYHSYGNEHENTNIFHSIKRGITFEMQRVVHGMNQWVTNRW